VAPDGGVLQRSPLRLSWSSAGVGEPLLLLHGHRSTHDDFAALRPDLDVAYRVLAPDLPGHGRSAPLPGRPTIVSGDLAPGQNSSVERLYQGSVLGTARLVLRRLAR
jgi:pimeloyl-ACP methyl ester carboxylesterase